MAMFLLLRRLFTVVYLMTHPAVPLRLKVLPVLAFIYLVFPRDLWFDFRAFGFLDDFIVGGLLVGTFVSKGWNRVLEAKREKDDAIPAEFRVLDDDDTSSTEDVPSTDGAPPTEGAPSAEGDPAPDDSPSPTSDAHDADGAPTSDLRG